MRRILVASVTAYDRKQSRKRCYNIYALAQYLARVEDVVADIDAGASVLDAINAGFCGPLLAHVTRDVKAAYPDLAPATQEKTAAWTYQPVNRRD